MEHRVSRSIVAGFIVSCSIAVSGCATLKSPGSWFSGEKVDSPTFANDLTESRNGITGQFKSMGSAVSSAYTKTKNVITAPFTADAETPDSNDATSLANMPSRNSLGPEIWVTQGQLFESKGNYDKALDNYSKALELEPKNEAALLSMARLHSRKDSHAEAAKFFEQAVSLKPAANTQNELALEYQALGNNQAALASIEKAIQMDPANVRYRNNYASMLVSTGRADEAVKNLEQVFSPAIANYNVAYLQEKTGNKTAAQQHLQLALQQDPNLEQARNLLAKISNGSAMQTARATYGAAQQALQTAQAIANPTIPATATTQVSATSPIVQSTGTNAPTFNSVNSMPSVPMPTTDLGAPKLPTVGSNPVPTIIEPPKTTQTSNATMPAFRAPTTSVPQAASELPYPPMK